MGFLGGFEGLSWKAFAVVVGVSKAGFQDMPGFKDSGLLDFTVSGVTVQSWNARISGCRVLWQIKRAVSFFIPLLLGPGVWSLPYGGRGSSGGLEA